MSNEAALKLGLLMIALAQRVTYVRLGTETSVLQGMNYTLQINNIKNGITKSARETISEEALTRISDVNVVADAMVTRMSNAA